MKYIRKKMKQLVSTSVIGGLTGLVGLFNQTTDAANVNFDTLATERLESESKITWTQFGPGNAGFTNLLKYHPTKPDTIIMCPDMWNAYQSDDNGLSWYNIKDYDGNGEFSRFRDASYSALDDSFGLAIESSQLWKTDDTGKSWTIVGRCPWYKSDTDGSDKDGWKSKISSLTIDPTDDKTWYIGAGKHIRGQECFSSLKNITQANPRGENNDIQGKIWKTTDSGATWTELNTGLDLKAQFCRIIVNPNNSLQVFAASQYGLYRSNNGGASWGLIGDTTFPNNTIVDMDFYYNSASSDFVLYVIDQVRYEAAGTTTRCTGGIYKSVDNGTTWVEINGNLHLDINRLTGGVPGNYYNYIAMWLGRSMSEVKSLYPDLPTHALQYFNSLNVDPSRPDSLYIGFADPQIQNSIIPGRLWSTSNGGNTWINTARYFGAAWAADSAYWSERGNPYNENMTMGHEPFTQQWGQNYPLRSMRACSVNSRGDVMMIAAHNTMLSTDHGVTWNQVDEDYTANGNIMGRGNSNLPGETFFQDKRLEPGRPYLASGEHHMWRPSLDGDGREALTYLKESQETVSSIVTHPSDANIIFTTSFRQAGKEKILRSTDGGKTFEDWGIATPAEEGMRTYSLIIDAVAPNYMYFGITDKWSADVDKVGGFYCSTDGGRTFSPRNTGLPVGARIRDLAFDHRDTTGASLFAAAEAYSFNTNPMIQGGLYHTADRGLTWTKIEVDASVVGVNHLIFDSQNRLYVTSGYRGASAGGVWCTDDYGVTWTQLFDNAGVECIDISPFNDNAIIISVGFLEKNPGLYLSEDRGLTWTKNNRIIGVPDVVKLVEFDLHDPAVLWLASVGSGFFKGYYPGGVTYNSIVHTIPGEIQAESFDYGAEGVAYHDTEATNKGNGIRLDEGVDIGWAPNNEGPCINWTAAGEWLNYTILTTQAGKYDLKFRVGTPNANATIGVKLGDKDLGIHSLPDTGGWNTYQIVTIPDVVIDAGSNQVLTITFPKGGLNLDYMVFIKNYSSTIPGKVEAENFTTGGEGVAYHDTVTINQGGKYRTDENVDIISYWGGFSIGYTDAGEWLKYDVDVEPGVYTITSNIAAPNAEKTVALTLGEVELGTVTIPATGGWSSYETVVLNDVILTEEKNQLLKLDFPQGGLNIDWILFEKQAPLPTYDITFINVDQTSTIVKTKHGEIAVPPAGVNTAGKTFTTWPTVAPATAAATYTAGHTENSYDITFINVDQTSTVVKAKHGEIAVPPAGVNTAGKTFTTWPTVAPATAAATYTALYNEVFTVRFDAGKYGSITAGDSIQLIESGSSAVSPTVTPIRGYRFTGWNKLFDMISSDLTITAEYDTIPVTQVLSLAEGRQLVSLNVSPSDNSMKTLLKPLIDSDSLLLVRDQDGNTIRKIQSEWIYGITAWEKNQSYLITLSKDAEFSAVGTAIAPSASIKLRTNYNFVPYFLTEPSDILNLLSAYKESIDYVYDDNGVVIPGLDLESYDGTFHGFQQGGGLMIKMNSPITFSYITE